MQSELIDEDPGGTHGLQENNDEILLPDPIHSNPYLNNNELICGPFWGLQANMERAKNVIFAATSPIPFQYITLRNIKRFAFLLILVFILYHGTQRNRKSNDSCRWLLQGGRMQGGNLWQPDGCMMHLYTPA